MPVTSQPGQARDGTRKAPPDATCVGTARSAAGQGAPRLVVADDHLLVLDSLTALLATEFTIVAAVSSGEALVEAAARLTPDLVLVDVGMPDLTGIEAGARLRRLSPKTALVFMTMDADPHLAAAAFAEGAAGYVLKSDTVRDLVEALRVVADGGTYLTKAIAGGEIANLAAPRRDGLAKLSAREREVLRYSAAGVAMKEVANRLRITPRTVAFHKYRGMATLGLRTQAELLGFALEHGLIDRNSTNLRR